MVVRPGNTKNPSAKVVLAKVRMLSGHFHHSERSVDIFRRVVVLHPCSVRDIIDDVVTRWGSTCKSIARLYT